LTDEIKLSIIVAIEHAEDNLPDILRALDPVAHPAVEFLFCHASAASEALAPIGAVSGTRVLPGAAGSLIPHLWRDGMFAARGERVATTTAHCIPTVDWVDALMKTDLDQIAAAGGTIENDPQSDAKGRAIFLLRYTSFAPPQAARDVREIAADNAVYRRSDLLRHRDVLARGFWEPSFHHRIRAEGLRLSIDPALRVVHRNRYSARQFMRQRFAHGCEFGLTRASSWHFARRLAMLVLTPVLFPLLLGRILRRAMSNPALRKKLATVWFWLPAFILAWIAGEARGYLKSLRTQKSKAAYHH
jgi:hypothetical protein